MSRISKIVNSNSDKLLALLDQGAVSTGNFVMAVVISRFAGLNLLGEFSLIWVAYFFLLGIFNSFIGLPFQVVSNTVENKVAYNFKNIVLLNSLLTLLFVVGQVVVFLVGQLGYLPQQNYSFLIPVAIVLMVRHEQIRRYLIAQAEFTFLFKLDVFLYIGQAAFIFALSFFINLSLDVVFAAIAFFAFIAFVSVNIKLNYSLKISFSLNENLKLNWSYGKYLIATHVAQWFSSNILLITLASISSVTSVGVVKIIQNLMGVLNIGFTVLENVVPGKASFLLYKHSHSHFLNYFRKVVKTSGILFIAVLLVFYFFQDQLLYTIYGVQGDDYHSYFTMYLLIYVFIFASTLFQIYLKTKELNKGMFLAYLINIVISLSLGKTLILNFEVDGYLYSLLILQVTGILTYILHIKTSSHAKKDHSYSIR